ncbi:hypothetical protein ACFL10_02385, partial [Patescibacteria group bacterium]
KNEMKKKALEKKMKAKTGFQIEIDNPSAIPHIENRCTFTKLKGKGYIKIDGGKLGGALFDGNEKKVVISASKKGDILMKMFYGKGKPNQRFIYLTSGSVRIDTIPKSKNETSTQKLTRFRSFLAIGKDGHPGLKLSFPNLNTLQIKPGNLSIKLNSTDQFTNMEWVLIKLKKFKINSTHAKKNGYDVNQLRACIHWKSKKNEGYVFFSRNAKKPGIIKINKKGKIS